jgi:hypothetical protein
MIYIVVLGWVRGIQIGLPDGMVEHAFVDEVVVHRAMQYFSYGSYYTYYKPDEGGYGKLITLADRYSTGKEPEEG